MHSPHWSQRLPPQQMLDPEALLEGEPASVRRSGVLPRRSDRRAGGAGGRGEGGVGSAGLPGEGGEGWGLGVTGRGAAELPAVFGGLAGLRGWRACLPQAGGWDLPCGRAETGDWPR